jgi:serine/threonine protein kinase
MFASDCQCQIVSKTETRYSQNILIKSKPPGDWWVKLCDLGLSKRHEFINASTTVRGTPGFMAPESIGFPFSGDPKTANPFSVDMWCLGETLFQMLTGQATFDNRSDLYSYQSGATQFPFTALRRVNASLDAGDFIQQLMRPDASQRLQASKAAEHPWLRLDDDSILTSLTTPTSSSLEQNESTGLPGSSGPWPSNLPMDDELTQASGLWSTTITQRPSMGSIGLRRSLGPDQGLGIGSLSISPPRHDPARRPSSTQLPPAPPDQVRQKYGHGPVIANGTFRRLDPGSANDIPRSSSQQQPSPSQSRLPPHQRQPIQIKSPDGRVIHVKLPDWKGQATHSPAQAPESRTAKTREELQEEFRVRVREMLEKDAAVRDGEPLATKTNQDGTLNASGDSKDEASKNETNASKDIKSGDSPTGSPAEATSQTNSHSTTREPTGHTPAAGMATARTDKELKATASAKNPAERDTFQMFKDFAKKERENAREKMEARRKVDKAVKLADLKKFASNFQLHTPIPKDLIGIIAKTPEKQRELQAKAIQQAQKLSTDQKPDEPAQSMPLTRAESGPAAAPKPRKEEQAPNEAKSSGKTETTTTKTWAGLFSDPPNHKGTGTETKADQEKSQPSSVVNVPSTNRRKKRQGQGRKKPKRAATELGYVIR